MAESFQHKLDRVRSPRVQITYDVETNGAMVKKELPFVVGIMAGLSGHRDEKELGSLKDRKFVEIDRDNVDSVMKDAAPMLNLSVENKLADDGTKLRMALQFKSMDDFSPANVAEQVAPLKELLDMRHKLNQLLSKMEGNDKLEKLLNDVIGNTEKAKAMKSILQEGEGK